MADKLTVGQVSTGPTLVGTGLVWLKQVQEGIFTIRTMTKGF